MGEKTAALELERQIRQCLAERKSEENKDGKSPDKVRAIIDQLSKEYAYSVHQPNARNGGLIGLAAAAIALGQNEVAVYLEDIIHPVLACFGDQDARVRYYACESLYNIAKVSKGEILLYFNEIFDVLCRLAADSDASVKNGADLLDRLIKDIVSEKATSYVSVIQNNPELAYKNATQTTIKDTNGQVLQLQPQQEPTAFSLPKFIPLLMERIYAINPFTRIFLVSWITLLNSVPDLELISYLPAFLSGMIIFLSDSHSDVRVITQSALDVFLHEIRRVSEIQKLVREQKIKKLKDNNSILQKSVGDLSLDQDKIETSTPSKGPKDIKDNDNNADDSLLSNGEQQPENVDKVEQPETHNNNQIEKQEEEQHDGELYIPGQDIHLDYPKIIEILISHLDSSEEKIQLVVLNWLDALLEISPSSFIPYLPKILSVLLLTMANQEGSSSKESSKEVNDRLLELVTNLNEEDEKKLNYSLTINTVTSQFLNENEVTRIAALDWLAMLHRKSPKHLLHHNDDTFTTLLKALSDSSEEVIHRDLQLLSDISFDSDDESFSLFMLDLLDLFKKDQKLLETRGNFILRQLCISLDSKRIYQTLSEVLGKEDDVTLVGTMIQILNNNLITAPELAELRKQLRDLGDKGDWELFSTLFKAWSHNAPAALALCLLAQAYELAYSVLQIFVDFEITVNVLVQIDILVQLLESPVFTRVRLQLLEPDKYPYLYKCLFGILMLLPQSTAFATLKNRLSSISVINTMVNLQEKLDIKESETSNKSKATKYSELLQRFRSVQEIHEQSRLRNAVNPKTRSALPKYNDTPILEKGDPIDDKEKPSQGHSLKFDTKQAVRKLSGRSFGLKGFGADK
ncbi:Vacuole morphology and inheritance protein 14 [Wickerhamomyces ciferrii]|uniref:Vacuole morphology and inheritance protein 14 n=1 Tax=Wickerhamomyces ciferrii (strain ATCC 14091 / BCRC 22168 / CBS 111 / JCM 3599 / NBRC 0793 / NRRL Y-1031 F-60-10) TaxID=1206466 RepID=K0KVY0_WICCF|nr:Vacuole morphology and inheritance protein 14 [Wickerhamomyces ciferrii]CCH46137.1 Vacuole morphology and inheritance protein 14 [Wickerhamomyces ciferrii]